MRKGLPRGAPSIESELIEGFISSWTYRVQVVAGSDMAESALGKEIIRLGATAQAQSVFDADNGKDRSPRSEAMTNQAEMLLEALDRATTSSGDEAGKIHSGLVSQSIPEHFFTAREFGFYGTDATDLIE